MINLTHGKAVRINANPKNVYVIECEAGFGDADGKKKIAVGPFKAENMHYLEEVIRVLKTMEEIDDRDEYSEIEGFDIWFGGELLEGMDENDPRFEFAESWPNDPFTDYSVPGYLKEFKIFYFNDQGIKLHVGFTLDNA